eukprot:CAMPEP_0172496186 /NCGR_PEP_ID=MMETSP1066-20121228/83002_1 /TAXON_ID=671091 /ORGANISM="Coscinodiscus wailesii, Strain CCMP2513" /LENGTH=157 /DNA_ID=CAMNT_0013268359 /DNA_START=92 /DNA_END=562 /DNA_ORIENTATION=+
MASCAVRRCGFTLFLLQLVAITVSVNQNLRCDENFDANKTGSFTISPLFEYEKCLRSDFNNGNIEFKKCNSTDLSMQWGITESGHIYSEEHNDMCLTGADIPNPYSSQEIRLAPCLDCLSIQNWFIECGKIMINGTDACAEYVEGTYYEGDVANVAW